MGRRSQKPRKAPRKLVLADTRDRPCQTAGALGPEPVPRFGAGQGADLKMDALFLKVQYIQIHAIMT